ncbi:MAG: extracellular solute-binding protein [Chloroflexi bacterium]|nr:extracellular solute-binding protein [Chloroflexota bacterium]
MPKSKSVLILLVLVALLAGLTQASAPATAQEEVTLVVWDNWTRDAEQAMIDQLNAEFEEAHPGVTIQREAYDTTDLTNILPLAMSEAGGPDVAMINQGYTGMGPMVEAGLLLPLDDYAGQFGWADRYAEGLHNRNSFSDDGAQMGEGGLYGVSNTAEVVGVFYHKPVFEELGLEVPETLADFEAMLATIAEAGMTPIVFGSLDAWPAIHEYSAIQHAYSSLAEIEDFLYRREGGTFDTEANLQAAQTLVSWVESGYFSPGYEGMDYDNATLGAFLNQEGVLWITGSWMAGTLATELGEDAVGFFLFPPADGEAAPLSIGGVGLAYGVRADTENPDLAAEYVDWVTGPRAAELLLAEGFLPAAAVDVETLPEGSLTRDVVEAWNTISSEDAVGHYLDWTMPDIAAFIQELMAGQSSPEEFVQAVEEAYQAEQ